MTSVFMVFIIFCHPSICGTFSKIFPRHVENSESFKWGGAWCWRSGQLLYTQPSFHFAPVSLSLSLLFLAPPFSPYFPSGSHKGERMQPVPAHTAPVSRRSLNSDSSLSLSLSIRHHFLKFLFKLVPPSQTWSETFVCRKKKQKNFPSRS